MKARELSRRSVWPTALRSGDVTIGVSAAFFVRFVWPGNKREGAFDVCGAKHSHRADLLSDLDPNFSWPVPLAKDGTSTLTGYSMLNLVWNINNLQRYRKVSPEFKANVTFIAFL